ETELVAMREILPMAQAPVTLKDGTEVLLVTLLPDQRPGLRREDGSIVVALQTRMSSGDASRDLAYAIEEAQKIEPGSLLLLSELPEPGNRLQDLLAEGTQIRAELTETFDFWVDPAEERTAEVEQALREAGEQAVPMEAVEGQDSAYWARMDKEFLRWIRPEDETELLNALTRLQAQRETDLEEGARLIGAFRACGLLVPVWELVPGTEAEELTKPAKDFEARLQKALKNTDPLTPDEKRVRAGLISRQVNLR
ncbi:MAG TPA: topoisomerase II, partial [Actinomycetales bacterium]|nr:topoisomerase II [Actinomycetales bacterium]